MLLIERYLLRQFAASFLAVATVLLLVGLGTLFTDVLSEIAAGKVPPGLLLSQMGLRIVRFLPLLLPLSLFSGPAAGDQPPVCRQRDGGTGGRRAGPTKTLAAHCGVGIARSGLHRRDHVLALAVVYRAGA